MYAAIGDVDHVVHVSEKAFKNELAAVVGSTRKGLNGDIHGSS